MLNMHLVYVYHVCGNVQSGTFLKMNECSSQFSNAISS